MSDNMEQTLVLPQSRENSSKYIATKIEHPRLKKTDKGSIRRLLRSYDQYRKKIEERVRQIVGPNKVITEAVNPVKLKICVDTEWIESLIELGLIDVVRFNKGMTDEIFCD